MTEISERTEREEGQPIWQMAQMRAALSEEGGRRAGGEQVQSSRRPYLLTTTAHICKMQSGSIKSPFNRLFAELLTERDPFFRRPTTINLDSFFAVHSCLLSPSNSLMHSEARRRQRRNTSGQCSVKKFEQGARGGNSFSPSPE